jgi:hypothetical protein
MQGKARLAAKGHMTRETDRQTRIHVSLHHSQHFPVRRIPLRFFLTLLYPLCSELFRSAKRVCRSSLVLQIHSRIHSQWIHFFLCCLLSSMLDSVLLLLCGGLAVFSSCTHRRFHSRFRILSLPLSLSHIRNSSFFNNPRSASQSQVRRIPYLEDTVGTPCSLAP